MTDVSQDRIEALGPAEQIIKTAIDFPGHLWHGRRGIVQDNGGDMLTWTYITKSNREAAEAGQLGEIRSPGMFPEAVRHVYRKALEIFQMDNELLARWASYEMQHDHRDLKVVLAALLLVQNRAGQPITEDGQLAFYNDDYREVGEAMLLHYSKGSKQMLSPKHIVRVRAVLEDSEIARMNREAGFGRSARRPPMGRYFDMLQRWLRYRERNPQLLEGAVKAGMRRDIVRMAQWCGYRPESRRFFEILRWPQKQAKGGHRTVAMDLKSIEKETWEGLSEEEICEKIVEQRLSYMKATAMLPAEVGLTAAIMAALIESGGMSKKDLIILTPTLEELGLLNDAAIKERWDAARAEADDQRARNIAKRVRSQTAQEELEEAADTAVRKEVEEAVRDLEIFLLIDISASMGESLDQAKRLLSCFAQGFPQEQLHAVVFNTAGRVIQFKSYTRRGVEHALSNFRAGGGTDYAAGILTLMRSNYRVPEGHDCIVLTVGDEDPDADWGFGRRGAQDSANRVMNALTQANYNPIGFVHLQVSERRGQVVRTAAAMVGVPFVELPVSAFEDVSQINRTLRQALESAPRQQSRGPSLIEKIMSTELLARPY